MILVNYHSLFASIVAELSDDLFTPEPCCVTTSTGNDTVNGTYIEALTGFVFIMHAPCQVHVNFVRSVISSALLQTHKFYNVCT